MRKGSDYKQLPPNKRYHGIRGISWSDMIAIESDVHKWLRGEAKVDNMYTRFGTHVHSMIEHGAIDVRRLGNPEQEFNIQLPTGKGKSTFFVVGRIDDYDKEEIIDYKTCKNLWTSKEAKEHAQLDGYALLLWKFYKKLPKKKTIIALETAYDEDAEGLYLTGRTAEHTHDVRLVDVLKIQARFQKAYWKVIEALN